MHKKNEKRDIIVSFCLMICISMFLGILINFTINKNKDMRVQEKTIFTVKSKNIQSYSQDETSSKKNYVLYLDVKDISDTKNKKILEKPIKVSIEEFSFIQPGQSYIFIVTKNKIGKIYKIEYSNGKQKEK